MKDPLKMLRQVQQMQDRMSKVQSELETETVEATAGGGAIRVVATGTQKLVSVTIDPDAAGELEMLQDMVVAAVNEAMEKSKELAAAKMQAVAAGLNFLFVVFTGRGHFTLPFKSIEEVMSATHFPARVSGEVAR